MEELFQTQRLCLRQIVRKDAAFLTRLAGENLPRIREIGLPVMPLHAYWNWLAGLEQKMRDPNQDNFFCFVATELSTGSPVGIGTITEQITPSAHIQIGVVVDKKLRGNRFGAEIIGGLTSFCFNILHIQELRAVTQKDNLAAISMLRLNRFKPVQNGNHMEFGMNRSAWNMLIPNNYLKDRKPRPVPAAA